MHDESHSIHLSLKSTPFTLLKKEVEFNSQEIADALCDARADEQADILVRMAINLATWPSLHGSRFQSQALYVAGKIPNEARADIADSLDILASYIRGEME